MIVYLPGATADLRGIAQWYAAHRPEGQARFFERFLKGVANGFEREPRVRLERRRTRLRPQGCGRVPIQINPLSHVGSTAFARFSTPNRRGAPLSLNGLGL